MLIHATAEQLAAAPWNCDPADPDDLLMAASLMVTEATQTAVYETDSTGHATDPVIAAALRDATCAQAKLFARIGTDPDQGGLDTPAVVRSKGIGTGRKEFDTNFNSSVTAFAARRETLSQLSDRALRILAEARLTNREPLS